MRITSDILEVTMFAAVASFRSLIHFAIRLNMPHLSLCQIGRCSWLFLTGLHCYIEKKKSSKSTVLSLDFTTNPLEQEHVRDRSVKCTPAVRKQLHRTTVAQNLPVLWHPIREPWINVPACMKDLWGRGVCRINIAVGLCACVQNNYMLHCCDKNGPKQLLFATNLAWEVPNSGGQKSHWILYASKYAFPGGCWLLVA